MPGNAFSRYRDVPVIEVDGQRALAQRRPRLPVTVTGAAEHVVVGGETLDLLAARYYGREALWWQIADANPTRCVFDLTPGERLLIPPLRVATSTRREP
jgi:nucleoid-associated protein YgaU